MKAIILAGGRATRLPTSAENRPKALVEIWGKPVLEHQIELLHSHGISDIRLSLGHKAEQIIQFIRQKFPDVEYVVEEKPLGTGGALKFALGDHTEPFLVLSGDILTDCSLTNFLQKAQVHTMVLVEVTNARDFGLASVDDDGTILEFKEKPEIATPGLINTTIYYLDPAPIKNFPGNTFSLELDIFPKLAKEKMLKAYIHRGFWTDMGTEERLKTLQSNPPQFFQQHPK